MKTFYLLLLLFVAAKVHAQAPSDLVIGTGASVSVFSEKGISIWGNVKNDGNIHSDSGAQIIFYGTGWINEINGTNPGGGAYHFIQPRPAPYVQDVLQTIDGNNLTGSFPVIDVENTNNIRLEGTDIKVRDSLNFKVDDGHIISNGNSIVIGPSGIISGYNELRFFVNDQTNGFLSKEKLSGNFDFPVGIAEGDYTPARLNNTGDSVQMNVMVRSFTDSAAWGYYSTEPEEGIDRVWKITQTGAGVPSITIDLQHNHTSGPGGNGTEGSGYDNTLAFITRYIGTVPNSNGGAISGSPWDFVGFNDLQSGTASGTITSGVPISNASEIGRGPFSDFSFVFFTKSFGDPTPLPVLLLTFQAHCENTKVHLFWSTASEWNVDHFEIEKSINGKDWTFIKSVTAMNAVTGHEYFAQDLNSSGGTIYYRLRIIDLDGKDSYSPVQSASCDAGENAGTIILYPNPGFGLFYLQIPSTKEDQVLLMITDELGREVYRGNFNIQTGGNLISANISSLSAAQYFIHINTSAIQKTFPYIKTN